MLVFYNLYIYHIHSEYTQSFHNKAAQQRQHPHLSYHGNMLATSDVIYDSNCIHYFLSRKLFYQLIWEGAQLITLGASLAIIVYILVGY